METRPARILLAIFPSSDNRVIGLILETSVTLTPADPPLGIITINPFLACSGTRPMRREAFASSNRHRRVGEVSSPVQHSILSTSQETRSGPGAFPAATPWTTRLTSEMEAGDISVENARRPSGFTAHGP